jgi:hypothetical protein
VGPLLVLVFIISLTYPDHFWLDGNHFYATNNAGLQSTASGFAQQMNFIDEDQCNLHHRKYPKLVDEPSHRPPPPRKQRWGGQTYLIEKPHAAAISVSASHRVEFFGGCADNICGIDASKIVLFAVPCGT